MAEINVVPYIDVMLVLLIIFMITAPMLTQGVQVDLPQASANFIEMSDGGSPLIVSVDAKGLFYIAVGDHQNKPADAQLLIAKTQAVLRRTPNTRVMIKGDNGASYGHVVAVMALLQKAGAPNVGLITKQPEYIE